MTYRFSALPASPLLLALTRAADALARLDERILRSPIKDGFLKRQDFQDTISSLWIDGDLVHLEDLVLHDARMDIRAPTLEVVNAHRILRARRLIADQPPPWALSDAGLSLLRGKQPRADGGDPEPIRQEDSGRRDDADGAEFLGGELAELDAALARSARRLSDLGRGEPADAASAPDGYLHVAEPEDAEEQLFDRWRALLDQFRDYPPLLTAVLWLDAFSEMGALERSPWLGRLLCAAHLRQTLTGHLPPINIGLRAISRDKRRSRNQLDRVIAILDGIAQGAQAGLKEHDRLLNGKARLERRLTGRRSNSRLPELVDLVLSSPVVSTSMIVKALGTTPQGAVGLAEQLDLRELTGRGRFRAWGLL